MYISSAWHVIRSVCHVDVSIHYPTTFIERVLTEKIQVYTITHAILTVHLQEIWFSQSIYCGFPSRRGFSFKEPCAAESVSEDLYTKYTITGGPDTVSGSAGELLGYTTRCRMSGCAQQAEADQSAGFCLVD